MTCIFCKVAQNETDTQLIYEDEKIVAFNDLRPKAPEHKLIIPREHIATLNDVNDECLIGHMLLTAKKIAKEIGIAEEGYRILMNCNKNGGQEIYHIHLHLLGGRQMNWPPG